MAAGHGGRVQVPPVHAAMMAYHKMACKPALQAPLGPKDPGW